MNEVEKISVVRVKHKQLGNLRDLWKTDWLEQHPGDDLGADKAAAGIAESLDHYDFLRSDSFFLLAARIGGKFVGYTTVICIPKIDNRLLFLFIDELFVLKAHRRLGAATAMLEAVVQLGKNLGAKGIRLITECDNETAKSLYQRNGFEMHNQLFCQRIL